MWYADSCTTMSSRQTITKWRWLYRRKELTDMWSSADWMGEVRKAPELTKLKDMSIVFFPHILTILQYYNTTILCIDTNMKHKWDNCTHKIYWKCNDTVIFARNVVEVEILQKQVVNTIPSGYQLLLSPSNMRWNLFHYSQPVVLIV